jgi:hypothetical protein
MAQQKIVIMLIVYSLLSKRGAIIFPESSRRLVPHVESVSTFHPVPFPGPLARISAMLAMGAEKT